MSKHTQEITTMSTKLPGAAPNLPSSIDAIDSAIASGAFGSITENLLAEARRNPDLDWNATIEHVLTRRVVSVGNRQYEICLMAIPLVGDLGEAFVPFKSTAAVLKEAQNRGLITTDHGLVFLDTPVPRETIATLSMEALYNIPTRLFERAARHMPVEVIETRRHADDHEQMDSMLLLGLVYWRSGMTMSPLLTSRHAQADLAEIVRQHMLFERITASTPHLSIRALPMAPLYKATRALAQHRLHSYIAKLINACDTDMAGATITVLSAEDVIGDYVIHLDLTTSEGDAPYSLVLELSTLCEGNAADYLEGLTRYLQEQGVPNIKTSFFSRALCTADADSDMPLYAATPIH